MASRICCISSAMRSSEAPSASAFSSSFLIACSFFSASGRLPLSIEQVAALLYQGLGQRLGERALWQLELQDFAGAGLPCLIGGVQNQFHLKPCPGVLGEVLEALALGLARIDLLQRYRKIGCVFQKLVVFRGQAVLVELAFRERQTRCQRGDAVVVRDLPWQCEPARRGDLDGGWNARNRRIVGNDVDRPCAHVPTVRRDRNDCGAVDGGAQFLAGGSGRALGRGFGCDGGKYFWLALFIAGVGIEQGHDHVAGSGKAGDQLGALRH
jgi:hypothetical protein